MVIQETKIGLKKLKEILRIYKPHYEALDQDAKGSAGDLVIRWSTTKILFED